MRFFFIFLNEYHKNSAHLKENNYICSQFNESKQIITKKEFFEL